VFLFAVWNDDWAAAVSMSSFFIGIAIICVGCTIAVQWRKAREAKIAADLKKEMIQRGMSPEEIERLQKAFTTEAQK